MAQVEKQTHHAIADKFEKYYNAESPDSIFHLFGDEMKAALPLEKTTEFLDGLFAQAGKITRREFKKYQKSYAIYKTKFERGIFSLNISLDDKSMINGLFIRPYTDVEVPEIKRNKTELMLPFREEWTVFWGGDTKELNYHVEHPAQKNAFDLVITDTRGRSFRTTGNVNEDYYAFEKEILAPCDGEVVMAVDGIKDNIPGEMNPVYIPGNTVIMRTGNNEYLFFAHFKQHSIKVKQGEKVKQGQLLGLCGNSGNSSEPHLHFHIQNAEDMNVASGVKCYFARVLVNGNLKMNHSPIKGEKIINPK